MGVSKLMEASGRGAPGLQALGPDADLWAPVTVDALRHRDEILMVRCLYLTVEAEDEAWDVPLALETSDVPFLVLGLSGVLCMPRGDAAGFDREAVEAMIGAVDTHEGLYVQTADFWLPIDVVPDDRGPPTRGTTYLVRPRLLLLALAHHGGELTDEELVERAAEFAEGVRYDGAIDTAFSEWRHHEMESVTRKYHHDRSDLVLKKRAEYGGEGR